jgi:hypothetical protein
MKVRTVMMGAALLGALGSACAKKEPEKRSYTLFWTAQKQPDGGVPVSLVVPPGWKETLDDLGAPSFTLPDFDAPSVSVVAIRCPPEGECPDNVVSLEFEQDELAQGKREKQGPERIWVSFDGRSKASGGRRRVHARLFAHETKSGSAVMCVITLMDAAGDKLLELKKVCETLAPGA